MKRSRYILSILLLLAAPLCHCQLKIAILDLDAGVGLDVSQVSGLQDMLAAELLKSGEFTIKERSHTSDIWTELEQRKGSELTNAEIKSFGMRLGVDAILVGRVNFQVRERSLEDMSTNMAHGEYNIDIRLVSIKNGDLLSAAGDVQKTGETTRSLMKRIVDRLIENYLPPGTDTALTEPIILQGYLTVFPVDLGRFSTNPANIIDKINRQAQYGYSDWRLPTSEELDFMLANKRKLKLRPGCQYAKSLSVFTSSSPQSVRLVRTEILTQAKLKESGSVYLTPSAKDLGTVKLLRGEVETSFEVVNSTATEVNIDEVKCSSTNIIIKPYNSRIMPGESSTVYIKMKTVGRQGMKLHRNINVVLTNGTVLIFKLTARIE